MRTSSRPLKTLSLLAISALAALVAAGCGTSDPDIDRGRTLFIENCGACHVMAQAGTSATIGPNLDHTFGAAREAGMDDGTVRAVVKPQILTPRPSTDNPTVSMPAEIVTGRDLEDVVAYVGAYAGVPGAAPPQVEGGPGAQVFAEFGCGGCHVLAAAGTTGSTGPNLDDVLPGQDAGQVEQGIVDPEADITPGYPAGVMPANYGDSMTDEQIEELVNYLLESVNNGGS